MKNALFTMAAAVLLVAGAQAQIPKDVKGKTTKQIQETQKMKDASEKQTDQASKDWRKDASTKLEAMGDAQKEAMRSMIKDLGIGKEDLMKIQSMSKEEVAGLKGEAKVQAIKVQALIALAAQYDRIAKAKVAIEAAQEKLDSDLAAGLIDKAQAIVQQEKIDAIKIQMREWAAAITRGKRLAKSLK